MKLTFVGGGNMASALIGGLLNEGFPRGDIQVVEVSTESRRRIEEELGVKSFSGVSGTPPCECFVLAVKPQQLKGVAQEILPLLQNQVVISIAAGIRTADLSRWLGGYGTIVRVMSNTPALVRMAISALYALPPVNQQQRSEAEKILRAVGETLWLEDEDGMDAITAVSGSGPAYVFYFLEALSEAAQEFGFDAETSRKLALTTVSGAAKLAAESPEEFATLRARVTSKGGTTERALQSMEAAAIKQAIVRAVRAAEERSKELGRELGS